MKTKLSCVLSMCLVVLFPVCTIINYTLNFLNIDNYFNIININLCGLDLLLIEYAYPFWKVLAIIMIIVKLLMFIILPIVTYIKRKGFMYVVLFIIVFLDFFAVVTVRCSYIIGIINIFYHMLALFMLGVSIYNTYRGYDD